MMILHIIIILLDLAYCITLSGLAHIISSHETLCSEGEPMIWANPRDVILCARSSYSHNNMFILYLYLTFFLIFIPAINFFLHFF